MSLAAEALRIACVVVPIAATGLFGIDKIIRKTDARVATIRAELDSTARMEMVKKFADNPAEARDLLGPLIDQVTEPQSLGLSATGRLNTLSVLAEVRPATWADNPAEAARLRASLAAIEARRAAGAVAIGTTTAAAIERILGNLPRG